jgi:hypothetical protein
MIDVIPKEKRPRVRKAGYAATAAMVAVTPVILSLLGHPARTVLIVSGAMLLMCVAIIELSLALGFQKGMLAFAVIVFVLSQIFG